MSLDESARSTAEQSTAARPRSVRTPLFARTWRSALGAAALGLALLATGCAPVDDETSNAEAGASAETSIPWSDERRAATTAEPSPEKSEETDSDDEQPDAATGSALAMLYELEIKGRAPKTGYDRDDFGWRDEVDRNGCDTRNDVLRRDLSNITLRTGGCVVLGGTLTSDYSGETFDFVRGDGNNIDIDHVVALSNAWQTGAQSLSPDELVEFGNDPLNLLAVESSLNQQKGDGDAATWLPPNTSYRCEYVARQITVKHAYDLWVVPPEFDAMERLLLDCDEDAAEDDPWPATGDGDVSETVDDEAPRGPGSEGGPSGSGSAGSGSGGSESGRSGAGQSGAGSDSGSSSGPGTGAGGAFKNCTQARDLGGAPVYEGQPGYGPHLDRDGDGVGCE